MDDIDFILLDIADDAADGDPGSGCALIIIILIILAAYLIYCYHTNQPIIQ